MFKPLPGYEFGWYVIESSESPTGFTGFDHETNQVDIPVTILACSLFLYLTWLQSFHNMLMYIKQVYRTTTVYRRFAIFLFVKLHITHKDDAL